MIFNNRLILCIIPYLSIFDLRPLFPCDIPMTLPIHIHTSTNVDVLVYEIGSHRQEHTLIEGFNIGIQGIREIT